MATAVIIHSPEDALPARALAEKLRAAKLTVVLEKSGDELRDALKSAPVTVALWSPRSIASPGVTEDVSFARGKSKVVHVLMQNAQAPQQFSGDKSVNLTGWRGEDEFAPWRELAKLVTDRAGVAPLPPPAPRPPSGFFTPGRTDPSQVAAAEKSAGRKPQPQQRASAPRQSPPPPPPRQSSPPPRQAAPPRQTSGPSYDSTPEKKGGGMGLIIGIVVLVLVVGGGGAGYMWWQGQQSAHASSAAFEQIDRNDPTALRAFIAAQTGAVKAQAQGALNELEERSYEAASDADTIESLQGFLHDFPNSDHALAARGRIAELQANPQSTDTTTDTSADQPDGGDQVAPGTSADTSTSGGPQQLTPPAEPSTSQEPPSAPATTTP